MVVDVRSATDLGLKRAQNEDSHGAWIPPTAEERRRRGTLVVVADGMGGSRAGEVASRLAVETVLRCYREGPGVDPLEELHHAVEAANRVVHRESSEHPELAGMGTTCTAVVLREADAYVAHVGDSRAYLIQDGRIRQLTRDHSLVAQLVREGQLTPEQAKVDPRRNVVTRSVGVGARVEIDAEHEPGVLRPGDTVLVCSDGLHGVVADEELEAAANTADMEQACRDAIALANRRGGPDNITLVVARVFAGDDSARRAAGEGMADAEEVAARDSGLGARVSPDVSRRAESSAAPGPAAEDGHGRAGAGAAAGLREAGGAGESRAPEKVGGEPVATIPRPYELREARRLSGTKAMLWLLLSLAVLLVAIAAMSAVVHRMGKESNRLGPERREAQFAWR
jgi:protein phosphatase